MQILSVFACVSFLKSKYLARSIHKMEVNEDWDVKKKCFFRVAHLMCG